MAGPRHCRDRAARTVFPRRQMDKFARAHAGNLAPRDRAGGLRDHRSDADGNPSLRVGARHRRVRAVARAQGGQSLNFAARISRAFNNFGSSVMRNGFKIVDTDTHLMEPDYVFEKYIDERYKSQAPKMGVAAESGRRTFLVEGEPFTREKGKYPMAAPAFFKAVKKAMERFERASKVGFSPESRLLDMDEQGVDVQIVYPT